MFPWAMTAIFGALLFASHNAIGWFSKDFGWTLLRTIVGCGFIQSIWGHYCLAIPKSANPATAAEQHFQHLDGWASARAGFVGGAFGGLLLCVFWSLLLPLTLSAPIASVAPANGKNTLSAHATVQLPSGSVTELNATAAVDHPVRILGWNGSSTTVATVATFGPPVHMLVFIIMNFVSIGRCGPRLAEIERERWSSLNARLAIIAASWFMLVGSLVYGPWLLGLIWLNSTGGWQWITGLASAGWFGALLSGIKAAQGTATGNNEKSSWISLLARITPILFLATIWLGLALCFAMSFWIPVEILSQADSSNPADSTFDKYIPFYLASWNYSSDIAGFGSIGSLVLLGLCTILMLLASRKVGEHIGVNTFTLQHLYQNRLVRCYLGASRGTQRTPDALTNFDAADDYSIAQINVSTDPLNAPRAPRDCGPYYIVNGALNQKATSQHASSTGDSSLEEREAEKLQFVERQAESFVFTSRYCGSKSTGYCSSEEFAENVSLGTAVAVSGAAVSPNSGYHSSPAVTALLTLFNVRLGAWFGHPAKPTRSEDNPGAQSLLLAEMFGDTDSESDYVYVSDGGHFENMGVYELIRRRCRFILAIDSGADPEFHENIGRLVRLVRIDFGIYIELDPATITPGPDGLCKSHIIVGRIHYGDVHGFQADLQPLPVGDPSFSTAANHGIILWIKNALTGDEPGDVRNYKLMNPAFPYETTLDQFFSESQFESYRALGAHSLLNSLRIPTGPVEQDPPIASQAQTAPMGPDGYPVPQAVHPQASRSAMEWVATKVQPTTLSAGTPSRSSDMALSHGPEFSTRQLFETTYRYWLQKPDRFISVYLDQNGGYVQIMQTLRTDARLRRLAAELYGNAAERRSARLWVIGREEQLAERLMANQMFTLLENVWFGLNFEQYADHPVHHGWRGVFKDWCASPILQAAWKDDLQQAGGQRTGLKHEYNPAFRSFLERFFVPGVPTQRQA